MDVIKNNSQRGQVALLVLLVLTVALTIGLSIISRTVSEIRIAGDTERSTQAYAAAEAGIEQALSTSSLDTSEQSVDLGNGNEANFRIITPTSTSSSTGVFGFPNPVAKDDAVQIWLFDYMNFTNTPSTLTGFFAESVANHSLNVYWGTPNKIVDTTITTVPALEVTLVYAAVNTSNNTFSNFGIEKYALDKVAASRGNNFDADNVVSLNSTNDTLSISNLSNQPKTFKYRRTIPLTGMGASKRYLLMRLKPLYSTNTHDIAIDPNPAGVGNTASVDLPIQGRIIESQGQSGNVVRRLKVYQSYPTLPGIFDFVLFNASSNSLTK